jgi:hypothetical protein
MLVMHVLALFTNELQNIWKEDIPNPRHGLVFTMFLRGGGPVLEGFESACST